MTHSAAHSTAHGPTGDRSQLEALWQRPVASPTAPTSPAFSTVMRQLGQELLTFFTGDQQLRVWTQSTRQGVVWSAYDPIAGQRISHCSEAELRVWIESRHHH